MKTNKVVYMVTYKDDRHRNHMTFVEGFSAVRFLEDRFSDVYFERTEQYPQEESNKDYADLLLFMI